MPSRQSIRRYAPTAAVIGDVRIGAEPGVWFIAYCAIVPIVQTGKRINIQDGKILHVDPG
jgi:carbonic anhydrase/acetyltransferase-like protein (isoleucine patch superfamily)